jgi:hypothetical protein
MLDPMAILYISQKILLRKKGVPESSYLVLMRAPFLVLLVFVSYLYKLAAHGKGLLGLSQRNVSQFHYTCLKL